jgi:hypothetical protein
MSKVLMGTRDTLTRRTMPKIMLWHTTAVRHNVPTSMQCSSYGKTSTIGILTTGALKKEFRCFFLPLLKNHGLQNKLD